MDEISELEAEERKKDREAESLAELEKTAAAHKVIIVSVISDHKSLCEKLKIYSA